MFALPRLRWAMSASSANPVADRMKQVAATRGAKKRSKQNPTIKRPSNVASPKTVPATATLPDPKPRSLLNPTRFGMMPIETMEIRRIAKPMVQKVVVRNASRVV